MTSPPVPQAPLCALPAPLWHANVGDEKGVEVSTVARYIVSMNAKRPPQRHSTPPPEQTREEKLAEALRANLRRRKAAAKSDKKL